MFFLISCYLFISGKRKTKGRIKLCVTLRVSKLFYPEESNDITKELVDDDDKATGGPFSQIVCQVLKIRVQLQEFSCENCDKDCVQRHVLRNHEVCIMHSTWYNTCLYRYPTISTGGILRLASWVKFFHPAFWVCVQSSRWYWMFIAQFCKV